MNCCEDGCKERNVRGPHRIFAKTPRDAALACGMGGKEKMTFVRVLCGIESIRQRNGGYYEDLSPYDYA